MWRTHYASARLACLGGSAVRPIFFANLRIARCDLPMYRSQSDVRLGNVFC